MELEELKKSWSEYDKKLNDNLKLNETLLRRMNLDKSKREIHKPYVYEITSFVVLFLTIAVVSGLSIQLLGNTKFCITGFTAVVVCLLYLIFSIMKINKFSKIDYYNSTVIKLQKDISLLKSLILRLRKVELILLPILIITILPILFKVIHGINIFENLVPFIIKIGIFLGICYPVSFWINRNLYDKKIKDVEIFLSDIENYEKEEESVANTQNSKKR